MFGQDSALVACGLAEAQGLEGLLPLLGLLDRVDVKLVFTVLAQSTSNIRSDDLTPATVRQNVRPNTTWQ